MIVDELFEVGEEVHWAHEMSSSGSITAQPSYSMRARDDGVAPLAASLLQQTCHGAPDAPLHDGRGRPLHRASPQSAGVTLRTGPDGSSSRRTSTRFIAPRVAPMGRRGCTRNSPPWGSTLAASAWPGSCAPSACAASVDASGPGPRSGTT